MCEDDLDHDEVKVLKEGSVQLGYVIVYCLVRWAKLNKD